MSKKCSLIFLGQHKHRLSLDGFDSFPSLFNARGMVVDENPCLEILRLAPLRDGSIPYLKRYIFNRLKSHPSWIQEERQKIERWKEIDFPGLDCAALGWDGKGSHGVKGALLLYIAPPGAQSLDVYLRTSSYKDGKLILKNLSRILGRIHNSGVRISDLTARHILVTSSKNLYFLPRRDLLFHHRSNRSAARDLACLSATIEAKIASIADRIRCLRVYLSARCLPPSRKAWRPWGNQVNKLEITARKEGFFPKFFLTQKKESYEGRLYLNHDFLDVMEALGFQKISDFYSPGSSALLLRERATRRNYRIDTKEKSFFLKVHRERQGLGQITMGQREWNNYLRLFRFGIPTAVPVSWGEGQGFSFFMVEACKGLVGDEIAKAWGSKPIKWRRDLIQRVAGLVSKLHACGFYHRDLYLCHIIVRDLHLSLIDLQRLEEGSFFRTHRRIKDLAALLYSSLDTGLSCTDRLRFLRAYQGGGRVTRASKRLVRAVEKKAKKIEIHDQKGRPR